MHPGSIDNPGTAAGRVYAALKAARGAWIGGWDLTLEARVSAVSTRVSEVRAQLELDPARSEAIQHRAVGQKHFYRIVCVLAGQGELFGECA